MSSNDYSARAGLLSFLHQINLRETFALVSSSQLIGQLVISNAAGVDNRVGR